MPILLDYFKNQMSYITKNLTQFLELSMCLVNSSYYYSSGVFFTSYSKLIYGKSPDLGNTVVDRECHLPFQ